MIGCSTGSLRKWTFTTWSHMCDTRRNLRVRCSYESCSLPMQNMHWVFSQMRGNLSCGDEESRAGMGLEDSSLSGALRAESDRGWRVWSSCRDASTTIWSMAQIFRATMASELKSFEKSQRIRCRLLNKSVNQSLIEDMFELIDLSDD